MRKTIIVFGHSKSILKKLEFFEFLEKKLNVKIRQTGRFSYSFSHNGSLFEILLCFNPKKDKAYADVKKFVKKRFKDILPPPAAELLKSTTSDLVLFFGIAGGLKSSEKVCDILLPVSSKAIYFKGHSTIRGQLEKQALGKSIAFRNFFAGKLKGKRVKDITTNITAYDSNLEGINRAEYYRKLKKSGDCVQKELFEIAKTCKRKKLSLGAALVCSDTLKERLKPNFDFEKISKVYKKLMIEAIEKSTISIQTQNAVESKT